MSIGNWSVSQPRSGDPVLESMDPRNPNLNKEKSKRDKQEHLLKKIKVHPYDSSSKYLETAKTYLEATTTSCS